MSIFFVQSRAFFRHIDIYHQQDFNSFFEVYGTPDNLLQVVQEDSNEIEKIAGCRVLGIIGKSVTGAY